MPDPIIMILIFITLILIIGIGWAFSTLKHFNHLIIKMDESEMMIGEILAKRLDVLSKIAHFIREHHDSKKDLPNEIFTLQQLDVESSTTDKQTFSNLLLTFNKQLVNILDSDSKLKSLKEIKNLQDQLLETQEMLYAESRVYNSSVSYYNQRVIVFPSCIIANKKRYSKRPFFEV